MAPACARPSPLIGHSCHLCARSGSLRGPRGGGSAPAAPRRRPGPRIVTQHGHMFFYKLQIFHFRGRDGRAQRSHTLDVFHFGSFATLWRAEPGKRHFNTSSLFFCVKYPDGFFVFTLNLPLCTYVLLMSFLPHWSDFGSMVQVI